MVYSLFFKVGCDTEEKNEMVNNKTYPNISAIGSSRIERFMPFHSDLFRVYDSCR